MMEREERLIALTTVIELTSMSRSKVYSLIKEDGFPQPINLTSGNSNRCSRWSFLEVNAWIEEKLANRSRA